jgi:hypothetical protein
MGNIFSWRRERRILTKSIHVAVYYKIWSVQRQEHLRSTVDCVCAQVEAAVKTEEVGDDNPVDMRQALPTHVKEIIPIQLTVNR